MLSQNTMVLYILASAALWFRYLLQLDQKFVIGKAITFREGSDISIFATGHMLWKSLEAAVMLADKGIKAEIINIHTIKPLDSEAVLRSVRKTGCAVSAEEHQFFGGLGDAIAQMLSRNFPVPQEYVGINDSFGESGTPEQLMKKYGLEAENIVKAAETRTSSERKRNSPLPDPVVAFPTCEYFL